jgi:hypothetical protein
MQHGYIRTCLLAAIAGLGIAAGGCSSVPNEEVEEQFTKTETSMTQAEQTGAQQRALTELQQAKDKLAEAKAAYEEGDEEEALRLAEEAQVDAQYAAARSQAVQDQEAAANVQRGIDAVRQDVMQPGSGASGSSPLTQ